MIDPVDSEEQSPETPQEGPQPLSPETVQQEFEDFVNKRFGGQVKVIAREISAEELIAEAGDLFKNPAPQLIKKKGASAKEPAGSQGPIEADPIHNILSFSATPQVVKTYLDQFVIRQDEAKKVLATAICDHYNFVKASINGGPVDDFSKQNILVLGPTGVGKTYLVRQLARWIGVPFVKADATRFSETGYVGANVDDLVHDLVQQAGGQADLAQYGIIYLDEADKLASGGSDKAGKDVNGRGVQFGLLKLMEETEIDLRSGFDMRTQMQSFLDMQKTGKVESKMISTKHILFIISGAFSGLSNIIAERLNRNAIGFNGDRAALVDDPEDLSLATTEDFVKFGFEPEFIGRLPVRVSCHELNKKDLIEVLTKSKGSILKQYKQSFSFYGIDLQVTSSGIDEIAQQALEQKTGARALMSVLESVFRDAKFSLPGSNVVKLIVDRKFVKDPVKALAKILPAPK